MEKPVRFDIKIGINSMIKAVLIRMKCTGCNPFSNKLYEKYFARTLVTYNIIMLTMQAFYLTKYKVNYKDISALVLDVVGFCAVWQINYKLYSNHIKKDVLLALYNQMVTKFWPIEDTFAPKQIKNIQELYKITKFVLKTYTASILCTLFGFCITSPLKNEHHLINNIWLPDFIETNSVYLKIILFFQFIGMCLSTIGGLMPFDQVFLLGIASGMAQLKLIKNKLRTVGTIERETRDDYQVIIECVKHHNMLFDFFNNIEQFSSVAVLHMLGTNSVLGVVTLFAFLVETNISQLITYVSIMISVAGQFYMYCLLGQFIQTETESVAAAAYGASWENIADHNVRMGILLIIQRSHKYARISMGGFLVLCLENFTRVARMMLSMLTLIVNMRNK